jgi:hypothetical protein
LAVGQVSDVGTLSRRSLRPKQDQGARGRGKGKKAGGTKGKGKAPAKTPARGKAAQTKKGVVSIFVSCAMCGVWVLRKR